MNSKTMVTIHDHHECIEQSHSYPYLGDRHSYDLIVSISLGGRVSILFAQLNENLMMAMSGRSFACQHIIVHIAGLEADVLVEARDADWATWEGSLGPMTLRPHSAPHLP